MLPINDFLKHESIYISHNCSTSSFFTLAKVPNKHSSDSGFIDRGKLFLYWAIVSVKIGCKDGFQIMLINDLANSY